MSRWAQLKREFAPDYFRCEKCWPHERARTIRGRPGPLRAWSARWRGAADARKTSGRLRLLPPRIGTGARRPQPARAGDRRTQTARPRATAADGGHRRRTTSSSGPSRAGVCADVPGGVLLGGLLFDGRSRYGSLSYASGCCSRTRRCSRTWLRCKRGSPTREAS